MMRKLKLIEIFVFISTIEILFSVVTTKEIGNILLKILFTINLALGIDLFTNLFQEKINKWIYRLSLIGIGVIFVIYYIYYQLFQKILTINSLINAMEQATPFINIIQTEIMNHWYIILGVLILLVLCIFLSKYLSFERRSKKYIVVEVCFIILIYIITISAIFFTSTKNDIYSPKNLYYNINQTEENVKQFGILTSIRLDIERAITKFKEKPITQLSKNEEIQISNDTYNILHIDFDKIEENTENEEVKELCEYIKSQKPTNKNEYTGRYAGKNLIVFVAESFSNLAIREDITPTLYKLKTEGINFNNFYTPLFSVSTADGEYIIDTSLLPAEGVWSMEEVAGKSYPYTYANILKKQEYETFAYHDYDYQYYERDDYLKTMGYDIYLAQGNGLEERMDFSKNPASDYDMVRVTMDDYINKDKFVAYYMTMSGHRDYNDKHPIIQKNWEEVKDLPYSNKTKGYLATQIELDKALKEVIDRLTEAGKLEETVIVITGDHYPYGLTLEEMQELTTKKLDENFEKYNMPFIVYNGGEKEKIVSNKYCSSMDVLPTILNLFGIDYDSRLLMGRDIFSDSEALVIFSNRSFITEKGRYNSVTETYSGDKIEGTYISDIKEKIYRKYRCSRLILENNFYNYIIKATY